ncbi:MAG TPA: hypothetical protein VNS58_20010 [Puia sp.]|nr:hypothetical protein [Puia sp.]
MAKKVQFDVSKVHYLHIKDLAFHYSIPETISLPRDNGDSIHFDLEIVKTIGLEEKILRLIFTVELKAYEKGKKEASATYVTEHLFKVENMDALINKSQDDLEVDITLNNTLTGLAYSTVRGLLRQKFTGTLFSNFILPVIRPADLGSSNPS